MSTSDKMYNLKKVVNLPKVIDVPKCMYEMTPAFPLPNDIGDIYYLDQKYGQVSAKEETIKVNIESSMGKSYCTDNFTENIFDLEAKQKRVLEKLQQFKGKLDTLLDNTFSIKDDNLESSDNKTQHEIINVIDSLKGHLLDVYQLEENEQDSGLTKKNHNTLMKQLNIFKEDAEKIAQKSENVQFLKHENDLHHKHEEVLQIIDALALLLKLEVSSEPTYSEDSMPLNIEMYQTHVVKLVEVLQNELSKISNKFCQLGLPLEKHFGVCNCIMPEISFTSVSAPYNVNHATSMRTYDKFNIPNEHDFVLKSEVVHDIVISANQDNPPYSLIALKNILKSSGLPVLLSCTTHSSVEKVNEKVSRLFQDNNKERSAYKLAFTVIWKKQELTSLMVSPLCQSQITAEANILRYISRLLPAMSPLKYEMRGNFSRVSLTDYWLDNIQSQFLQGSNKERQTFVKQLNVKLGTSPWIEGDSYGLVDIFAWSALLQLKMIENMPNNVVNWFKKIHAISGLTSETFWLNQNGKEISGENIRLSGRKELESYLNHLGIKYQSKNHPEVFTVNTMMKIGPDMPGLHTKNLFLKDKKKDLYLLVARHDAQVNMKEVAKQTGIRKLCFAEEDVMFDLLGVRPGSVTLYALMNDVKQKVKLLLDKEAFNAKHAFINFHPFVNSATLGISPSDLQRFLKSVNHEPLFLLNL